MEKYIVLGASPNPLRHSHKMVKSLVRHGKEVIPVGIRSGTIAGIPILTGQPTVETGCTLLLYVGSKRQKEYYSYILDKLKPGKIVFNPGTENNELSGFANKNGITVIEGCALVMANDGQI